MGNTKELKKESLCSILYNIIIPTIIGGIFVLLQKLLKLHVLVKEHTGMLITTLFIALILVLFYLCMFIELYHIKDSDFMKFVRQKSLVSLLYVLYWFGIIINIIMFILSIVLLIMLYYTYGGTNLLLTVWVFLLGVDIPNTIIMVYFSIEIILHHDKEYKKIIEV